MLLAISNIISTLQLAELFDSMDDVQRTIKLSLCTSWRHMGEQKC